MKKPLIELTEKIDGAEKKILVAPDCVMIVEVIGTDTFIVFLDGSRRIVLETPKKVRQLVEPPHMLGQ